MRAPVLVQAHRHAAEGSKLHQLLRPRIMRCLTRCTNQHRAAWIRALVETRRWQPHGRPDVGPQLPTSGRPLNRPAPTPRHSPTIARRRQIAVVPTLCALAPTCVTPRARADAAARIAKILGLYWMPFRNQRGCLGAASRNSVLASAARAGNAVAGIVPYLFNREHKHPLPAKTTPKIVTAGGQQRVYRVAQRAIEFQCNDKRRH